MKKKSFTSSYSELNKGRNLENNEIGAKPRPGTGWRQLYSMYAKYFLSLVYITVEVMGLDEVTSEHIWRNKAYKTAL